MENLISIISSLSAIAFAVFLIQKIKQASSGSGKMIEISQAIREGAKTFLKREFKVMVIVLALIALGLGLMTKSPLKVLVFLGGAGVSYLAGYIGMMVSTQANVRTTEATRISFSKGFKIAFSAGMVMGFLVVGLGLLGISTLWFFFKDVELLISFAFGSSLTALFLRVGGGIFTKSADIGADLVGKIEIGIPEDDIRNPAVIADQVGDNVGDIAGMGSDLFETYVSAIIASMVIGWNIYGVKGVSLPIILASAGILSSLVGSFFIRVSKRIEKAEFNKQIEEIQKAMGKGILIANVLMVIAAYLIISKLFNQINLFYSFLLGLGVGFLIGKVTEYYTAGDKPPVLSIAKASQTGASILIIEGLSVGIESIFLPILGVAVATVLTYYLGGLYGIAIASIGILGVLGINLSADCYGPIADNAAGISEMAGLPEEVRQKTEALDAVGNTTAAAGKGFAIGSAGLVALAWLAAFFQAARLETVNLSNPKVMAGLFIGAMLSFLFSSLLMRGVSRGGLKVVKEVRRQFKEIPGLREGKVKPDYGRCIDLVTKISLKEMILPGILIILVPILAGLFLGVEGLAGILAGSLIAGFPLALTMANAGGAWDNAKKYIEAGNLGGKGSAAHRAAIIGDTVGDPFKDTSGPAIDILIKLIGKVALISLPLFL
ncbi:MAG: sodium-translocating pyrophosphatase [Candidatus Nealsonbacteria bacterium]